MATLRNKRKLAALNKEKCEEHPRSNLAQNSNASRSQDDYITQVSQEIEGRATNKLSQEFSGTESRILGVLFPVADFLLNAMNQCHSGTTQEPPRRRPETHTIHNSERMRTTHRDILMLKQASFRERRHETLVRKSHMTKRIYRGAEPSRLLSVITLTQLVAGFCFVLI